MSIPNKFQIKRYIAQVSKEKENIPNISIENVIKISSLCKTKQFTSDYLMSCLSLCLV